MKRYLNLLKLLKRKSHFLFGPRGVGKSYLIRQQLRVSQVQHIDLLDSRVYLRLKAQPYELEAMAQKEYVAIDEIQRIPELLEEVHRLIELKNQKFLLTGSSARKLKRGGANLLAGRAYVAELRPLTWLELKDAKQFALDKYLLYGGLPTVPSEKDPSRYLYNYVDTYLREEIQAEALVRNLANYTRFLRAAAMANAELVNFTSVGNDAQLSPNTVRDYYQILEDTFIGFMLPAWTKSKKRKAIQTAKFYFFDTGVVNALLEVEVLNRASNLYGKSFEQFIAMELKAYLSYKEIRKHLFYWRSTSDFEVDFIIGDEIAIEVKATSHTSERDHRGLLAIKEEKKWQNLLLVTQDTQSMKFKSGICHIYWQDFLSQLWAGKFV